MAIIEPIRIEGLRDLRKMLKDLDGESQKRLRIVFNNVAEDVVARTKRKVPSRSGKARASVRAQSTQTSAIVKAGSQRKAPYYPWLDFGGRVGRNKSVVRAFKKSGRYLYVAFDESPDLVDLLEEEMLNMLRDLGLI